jgi:endonuclease/exonuclease/phosphatase family metal-dependent hydrolase
MRILFWNLGYGRGHTGPWWDYVFRAHRFFFLSVDTQVRFVDAVARVVERERPDVFSFAEISIGDIWNQHYDQFQALLERLPEGRVCQRVLSKYGESVLNGIPFHRGNSNGVISFVPSTLSEWYLEGSRKKLVIEACVPGLRILTVHLPLVTRHREAQLRELAAYVRDCPDDVVVCGDFNLFGGIDELAFLQAEAGLSVVPGVAPTYPTAAPSVALDVALYRFSDSGRAPHLRVLDDRASDHLPILVEWA